VLAAKMREGAEIEYYHGEVEPLLDARVHYVGEVDRVRKLELLGSARALLNPIQWPEPFGLVMIEALGIRVAGMSSSTASSLVASLALAAHQQRQRQAAGVAGQCSTDPCCPIDKIGAGQVPLTARRLRGSASMQSELGRPLISPRPKANPSAGPARRGTRRARWQRRRGPPRAAGGRTLAAPRPWRHAAGPRRGTRARPG
jgi:hypothetical protein